MARLRSDIQRDRAAKNTVRDDLVKWQCDGGEIPPIIAKRNERLDALERRLDALESRVAS